MSEHEFELYLSLLGRLLRLDPTRREQIADELRDHLEARLEELTAQGQSRPGAVQQALEEFGDAACLAAHFSEIANRKKRRLVMRCTVGSIAAAAAAILLTMALWPDNARVPLPGRAVAQQAFPAPIADKKPAPAISADEQREAAVEAKLDTRLSEVDFIDVPLVDVIAYLGDQTQLDILLDKKWFEDQGYSLDTLITLELRHTSITARTALTLALEQMGDAPEVTYTIRDGLVYIPEKSQANEIKVYNCRDLLYPESLAGMAFAPGVYGSASPNQGEMGMMPGMPGGTGESQRPQSPLVNVVMSTVRPASWAAQGQDGSIEEFNGLLIVKHSQSVHREIKQLLDLMRAASKE